ncbi:MAG: hypothetical protein CMH57_03015 [Myxococcales bacterium]|nr:hypothetical protein [Myxococcales bacterium]
MSETTRVRQGNLIHVVSGALIVGLACVVVWDTLVGSEGGAPEAWRVEVSAEQQLAPDRFAYSERLKVEACAEPREAEVVCLGAIGRDGAWLGAPRALTAGQGEGCWGAEVSAADLSDAHYGPLWVVVVSGVSSCQELGALREALRGQQRPRVALASEVERLGWAWGAARIYVHDKLQ